MSLAVAPKIDKRSYEDILHLLLQARVEIQGEVYQGLREKFTREWPAHQQKDVLKPRQQKDVGVVMLHLFARLMEITIERLNRVPDKHFVAFLDRLGIERLPGNPARVPVTFIPAPKSRKGRYVPAGTQVATTQTEKANAIIFETEESFDLTVAKLEKVFTIDPAADRYRDLSSELPRPSGRAAPILKLSDDNKLADHILYIAHDTLFSTKTPLNLELKFQLKEEAKVSLAVVWERYDGKGWVPLDGVEDKPEPFIVEGLQTVTKTISEFGGTEKYTLDDQEDSWIRCKLATPLTMAPEDLSQIESIKAKPYVPDAAKEGIAPDQAFFNIFPIDLNRNFFPFGEKPQINDCFYISCEEAFSTPDPGLTKTVIIKAELSPIPGISEDQYPDTKNITLAWEYWDEGTQAWEEIGRSSNTNDTETSEKFTDTTVCFTVTGEQSIEFSVPTHIAKVTVNGVDAHWIRVRIVEGNYGEEAHLEIEYETDDKGILTVKKYFYKEASFKPPFLSNTSFRISYARSDEGETVPITKRKSVNHFKMDDHSKQIKGSEAFKPFITLPEVDETWPALYLGYSESFDINNSISQYFHVESEVEFGTALGNEELAPQIVWEYFSDSEDWRRLDVRDGTRNFDNSGTVVFTAPTDMKRTSRFGIESYWLRARYGVGQLEHAPKLLAIHPNTMWTRNVRTIENEVLGSGTGQPGQVVKLSQVPILLGESILIREANPPSPEEETALTKEEEDLANRLGKKPKDVVVRMTNPLTGKSEIWVRWHPVGRFLESVATSRHYVIDRVTGEITFGDGLRGMVPPVGKDNIKAEWYQAGGGAAANEAATEGAVKELKSSLPFVSKIINPVPATGGSDAEEMANVKERGPQTLKHRNRAVTVEDFDWLVREASTRIALAKTLPTTNRQGETELGFVTVVIVPKSEEAKPMPSPELLDQVRNYLTNRAAETIVHRIHVVGPEYVEVSVSAQVFPVNPGEASVVEGRVVKRLEEFLHPLLGGPENKGWPLGRDGHISEIYAVIEATEGVDYVLKAEFRKTKEKDRVEVGPYGLVYSGIHQVLVGKDASLSIPSSPQPPANHELKGSFLGNASTGEVHDLQRQKPPCNIRSILSHHRIRFSSLGEALRRDFDTCGHCIGRRVR